MSVPHIRARSSKNALTPEDGRRNDRPKRRASVNRLEVDVNRPTDFNTNDLSPPQSGFRKSFYLSLSHTISTRHICYVAFVYL